MAGRRIPTSLYEWAQERQGDVADATALMRIAQRQETDEAFARIAGEARLHGLAEELDEGWVVCVCANGRHDPLDRASDVLPTEDEADREHLYVAASHVIRLRRMVLNAPPEVTR